MSEHGIDSAVYSFGQPCLYCLCGFSAGPASDWEDAGRSLDDHLRSSEARTISEGEQP